MDTVIILYFRTSRQLIVSGLFKQDLVLSLLLSFPFDHFFFLALPPRQLSLTSRPLLWRFRRHLIQEEEEVEVSITAINQTVKAAEENFSFSPMGPKISNAPDSETHKHNSQQT